MLGQRTDSLGSLLDLDPELGEGLAPREFEQARAALVVRLTSIPPSRFDPGALDGTPRLVGFLIIDGMACREIRLRDCHLVELLGAGDVVQPPRAEPPELLVGTPTITVIRPLVLAELGPEFASAVGRWPGLLTGLLQRLEQQQRRLIAQELIIHLRRADERLLLMLWLLADRWGHVTPEGIHLRLGLTHGLLGQLTAAQRPTVSLALGRLEKTDFIRRMADGTWVITRRADDVVARMARTTGGPILGETLRLRQQAIELPNDAWALRASALAEPSAGSPHGR